MKKIKIIAKYRSRVDKYLSIYLKKSRKKIEELILSNSISINGNNKIKKKDILNYNDLIEIEFSLKKNKILNKNNISFKIIFEDDYLIIIDKPKNVVVHPAPGYKSETLIDALLKLNIPLANCRSEKLRPGIVHRIDKDTSGLLVLAKNKIVFEDLKKQFKNHTVKRIYLALVEGEIEESCGEINLPIKRDSLNRIKFTVENNGIKAKTYYKVFKSFKNFTLIACKLETGRTHQIRVHFSYINHPVVGDYIYNNFKNNKKESREGQYLHACLLGFIHPITKYYMEFFSHLPEYYISYLKKLSKK